MSVSCILVADRLCVCVRVCHCDECAMMRREVAMCLWTIDKYSSQVIT